MSVPKTTEPKCRDGNSKIYNLLDVGMAPIVGVLAPFLHEKSTNCLILRHSFASLHAMICLKTTHCSLK